MSDYDPLWEEGKSDLIDRIHELEDAAEFEARVAAKMSALVAWAYDDGWSDRLNVREYQPQNWADVLKEARLAVEE